MKKCTSKQWDTCRVEKMGCYGCAYNDNREEYKKILEDWLNFRKLNPHIIEMEDNLKVVLALENLIKGYKELEEYIEKNKIKEKLIKDNYIPKSLVRKKIEKLNQEEVELQDSISAEEREEYSDAMISWQLCDINNKKIVLQELLEERN